MPSPGDALMQIPLNDPAFVREQYRDGTNLDARIALHARFSTASRSLPEWVFDQFDLPPDARVLEVGCGTGQLWTKNRSRIPASWQLILTDVSFGMAQTARATGIAARFVQSDAQAIPFRDAYFDAVIANHMLYHVPDLPRALGEIRRVLKTGGKFYAATNGRDHLRELDELAGEFGIKSASAALQFTLENGEPLLANYFPFVRRINFADALVVTEVDPLVAYIGSMFSAKGLRGTEAERRLRQVIADRLARDGAIHITKSPGLFVAEE
ncbi:MAG: class I SAM-dependent methyltransferase [Chloroflexota bacterium]|nr:class I SAM-dependent methyltransferase [Chloroflexota bacterium]